jgi:LysR family transcriptional regulator, glycine cleavage system transcriptional activator
MALVRSMTRTPSLDALRIFVVAARHLSFTDAANELNLTQSAVSHRIRGLEEELGLVLFNRLTRRLELTSPGQTLARRIEKAICEIDRSIVEVSRADQAWPIKVTMLPSVASHWLIPRLGRMRERHPDLNVRVIADPRLLDLRAEGIDVAIRFGRAPYPGYKVTRLMGDRVFPICAPSLLHENGPIDDIDALLKLPLLHDSATDADGSASGWRSWLAHHHRSDLSCDDGQHFSEAGMPINAAMLGLGIALARASLVVDKLQNGSLVCPLKLSAPTSFSYHVLSLPEAEDRPGIRLLLDLLAADAAATEAFRLSDEDRAIRPGEAFDVAAD